MGNNTDKPINELIAWFKANAFRLHSEPDGVVADRIWNKLSIVNNQLGIEVAEGKRGIREVIVTAFSDSSLFGLVDKIVESLSDTPGWKFIALKPPRGFAFKLSISEYEIDANALEFSPISDIDSGYRLVLPSHILRTLPNGPEAEELAWLIVETGVGEAFASRIKHLEFGCSDGVWNRYPIAELESYLLAT